MLRIIGNLNHLNTIDYNRMTKSLEDTVRFQDEYFPIEILLCQIYYSVRFVIFSITSDLLKNVIAWV
jgi:hypothetical protein